MDQRRLEKVVKCETLDDSINYYLKELGFRLDMIMPADAPRIAVVSKNSEILQLVLDTDPSAPDEGDEPTKVGTENGWVTGRAGMMYRDLIPGRAGGKIVASHIRLAENGPVPDYVHYHKIQFQMIYCLRGRIRVVYEDQGPPFWLEAGDCVLQPPEIRHRVLESSGEAEVVEISMPSVHETWVEHEIQLPISAMEPDRDFIGQRFCRYVADNAEWLSDKDGFEYSDTGISTATLGFATVRLVRSPDGGEMKSDVDQNTSPVFYFCFVTGGELNVTSQGTENIKVKRNESLFFPKDGDWSIIIGKDTSFLEVSILT